MAYKAHGECNECGFIGDMWWHDEPVTDNARETIKVAVCPVCLCDTPASEMAEVPGE